MSWIDIYLSDGKPSSVYGADAEKALRSMLRFRDIPYLWLKYHRSGLTIKDSIFFIYLDIIRNRSYQKGFKNGAKYYQSSEENNGN